MARLVLTIPLLLLCLQTSGAPIKRHALAEIKVEVASISEVDSYAGDIHSIVDRYVGPTRYIRDELPSFIRSALYARWNKKSALDTGLSEAEDEVGWLARFIEERKEQHEELAELTYQSEDQQRFLAYVATWLMQHEPHNPVWGVQSIHYNASDAN